MLFAGVDGGQSSTVALIADEHGMVLGRGIGGPSDHIGQAPDSRRLAGAVEDALGEALRRAGLSTESEFDSVVAGISGFEGTIHGLAPRVRSQRMRFVHDAPIAHAGAFALGAGIVVIAGTGSVAYGNDAGGREVTIGGWGYLFGDEGSAFEIARRALSRAMQAEDDGHANALGDAARTRFGEATLRELAREFYLEKIDRAELAGFATEVMRLADDHHPDAQDILDHAARSLMRLAWICAARLALLERRVDVALVGGVFANERFRLEVARRITETIGGAEVVPARYDPPAGALLLAYKEAGIAEPPALVAPAR